MATLLLTAVGTVIGGPIGGALGAILGQRVDQAVLGPTGKRGPRLGDLSVQTSSYGTALPRLFGTMRVAGTVIWSTDLREDRTRSGGGKGQPKTTSYSYSASFAVTLSARPIRHVGRIWADGNLLRGAAGDFKSATGFRLYQGHEDQDPDPLIASAEGIGMAPAYRGCAYVVFEDFQLGDYGNRIPSLTFEVEADAGPVSLGVIAAALSEGAVVGEGGPALGGYAAAGDSVRGAIETLADILGFRLSDSGSRLALVTGGIAMPIAPSDWLPDSERARTAALAIPDSVSLAYYEPTRDYQAGLQRASRGGPGRRSEMAELPVALTAAHAKAIAEARLARLWSERERLRIVLPWRWLALRPGGIVTIEDVRWRIAEWTLETMALHLDLIRAPMTGAAATDAEPGRALGSPDAAHGPTLLHLIEVPGLDDIPLAAPRLYAVAAGPAMGWRRAALSLSLDDGASWTDIGTTASPATIGIAETALGAGSALQFDAIHRLDIALAHGDMTLESADDSRLIGGANLALLGNELIQFGHAEPLGAGRWRLSRLLRGRRGTEAAMSDHGAGERFILIEARTLLAIDVPIASLGGAARAMASGLGDDTPVIAVTSGVGISVRPPAPAALTISERGDGGFDIGWVRRSRQGWRWTDGIDAPIGEEREAYRLTILTGHGAIRIAETDTSDFIYTAAMAAADGGVGDFITVSVTQTGSLAASLPAAAHIFPS